MGDFPATRALRVHAGRSGRFVFDEYLSGTDRSATKRTRTELATVSVWTHNHSGDVLVSLVGSIRTSNSAVSEEESRSSDGSV